MEQEELPEHQKLLNERQDKENRINMQLISETSLQAVPENEDKKYSSFNAEYSYSSNSNLFISNGSASQK